MALDKSGMNFSEGERPPCPKDKSGKHDDYEERMYAPGHEGLTRTCRRCGMREFIIIH